VFVVPAWKLIGGKEVLSGVVNVVVHVSCIKLSMSPLFKLMLRLAIKIGNVKQMWLYLPNTSAKDANVHYSRNVQFWTRWRRISKCEF